MGANSSGISGTLPVRVYYEDTDMAGVVYHANYLKYMERARTELLRQLGFDQSAVADQDGAIFTVRHMELDFIRPARMDEALEVVTSVKRMRPVSIEFEQVIRNDKDDVVCRGHALCVCIDRVRFKPRRIPPAIAEELSRGN